MAPAMQNAIPPISSHSRNCGCKYWSIRPLIKKAISTPPNPNNVSPLKILAAKVRINGRQESGAKYPDNDKKSNPERDHHAFLQQRAVQKKELKIKHRSKNQERHPCRDREGCKGRCDK